jgi:hypothetical protein
MRRLDLATLQWEAMPSLVLAREDHVCCAVRGALVVLGGDTSGDEVISIEMLSKGEGGGFHGTPALVMRRDIGRSMLPSRWRRRAAVPRGRCVYSGDTRRIRA